MPRVGTFFYPAGSVVLILGACCMFVACAPVHATSLDEAATLASPLLITGDVTDGDIVVYDDELDVYRPSERYGEENLYGVVVDDPVLFLGETDPAGLATNTRPVVTYGEVYVNASDIEGDIRPGDLVTSSRVIGRAQRFSRDDSGMILGFALDAAAYGPESLAIKVDDVTVRLGKVLVTLRPGYYDADRDRDKKIDELLEQIGTATSAGANGEKEGEGFDTFLLFRYILGSFVAITAVVLALRRFGDLFAQSIISVGRNPLARAQIRSILVWNAVLIVIVSGVGLGIGVAIIAL